MVDGWKRWGIVGIRDAWRTKAGGGALSWKQRSAYEWGNSSSWGFSEGASEHVLSKGMTDVRTRIS